MERVLGGGKPEIVIVGAGPAGISTALFLAKYGIPSTLIEKGKHPRDKICGDGLSGWVITMLRRLNPELVTRLQMLPEQMPSCGMRFFAPNMKSLVIPYRNPNYPDEVPGHVMRRIDFDRFLLDEARASPLIRIMEEVNIANFAYSDNGVRLTDITGKLHIHADLCVIATGAGSKLARSAGVEIPDDRHQATGIRQYFSGVTGIQEGNYVDFYFLKEFLPGYLWVFPLPNGRVNVGAGIRTDILRKKRFSMKLVMEEALIHNPHLAERFKNAHPVSGTAAWTLPLGNRKARLSGERFLLAGDAASLVDPFTGEGIGNALWSGSAAADHIEKAIAANRFDAAYNRKYDRAVHAKFNGEFRLSRRIQQLICHQKLFNWVMTRLTANPAIQQSVLKMTYDMEERKKLIRPSFYFRLLAGKGKSAKRVF